MDEGAAEQVDFFVSYTGADRAWAEWIAWELERAGYRTVLQAWDFRPGANFVAEMRRSLARASRLLAVLSPAYLFSPFARAEWDAAFASDPQGSAGRRVPVRVVAFDPPDLDATTVHIDLVGTTEDQARDALLAGVRPGRAKPGPRPFPGSPAGTFAGSRAASPPVPTPPPFPGSLPPVWNLTHHRNPNFVGREALLHTLGVAFADGPSLVTKVITGLGGVGKTQLTVELAYRHRERFDVVWWVRAENPLSLRADLAALAAALQLGHDTDDLEARAAMARRWLEHHDRWLLVLDNADDPTAIASARPQGGGGIVLITSRGGDWQAMADVVLVDVMAPDEAEAFLSRRSRRSEPEAARELAAELGYLPLALEQAAAFVAQTPGLSVGDYLGQYRQRDRELWLRGRPSDYPDTVATTWDLALQRATEASPAAADLLRLMAFLHPDGVPLSILDTSGEVPGGLAAVAGDRLAFADAVGALAAYSLLRGTSGDSVAVHRLVQAVIRDRLDDAGRARWAATALHLVALQFPHNVDEVATWTDAARMLPHAQVVASHLLRLASTPGASEHLPAGAIPQLVSLLTRGTRYLLRSGQRMDAVVLAEATAGCAGSLLGPEHVETLRAQAVQALAYQLAGRTDEAVALGRQVLAHRVSLLGDAHLETVSSRADLAVSLQWARSPSCLPEAIELGEKALEQRKDLLEPDHPDTLWSRAELSWSYWWVGRVADAIALREQVRDARRKTVGDDHPAALWDEANVAISYQMVGRAEEALVMFEAVLEARRRLLGPDHPDTLFTSGRLGHAYQAVGRVEEAITVGEGVVNDSRRVLGDDHPDTLSARSLLAASYRSGGRIADAVALGEEVLADRQRLLAPDHLDVLWALDDLACSYQLVGRRNEALTMTDHVYVERLRILGPDHPDTVATGTRRDELAEEDGAGT